MHKGVRDMLLNLKIKHLLPADEDITHEVITTVDAPVSKCFKIWENRMNWLEWFDLLGQVSSRLCFQGPVARQRLGALLAAMWDIILS